jgi:hypothetical protein
MSNESFKYLFTFIVIEVDFSIRLDLELVSHIYV